MNRRLAAVGAMIAALAAHGAAAAAPPATPGDVSLFQEGRAYVFRSNDGLALYTFDKDGRNRSNCTGPCAASWPPLMATADARPVGDWSLVQRSDGKAQWAWRGKPVYTHAKDAPARAVGDGAGGAWRLIPPLPK